MATKRKIKQKGSTAQNEENKSKDLLVLEEAKRQEQMKRLKTVRIDARTIISVPVWTNPILAAERFRNNVNALAERHG